MVDRNLWIQALTENQCPPWPCPSCGGVGHLTLIPERFTHEETLKSKRSHDDEAFTWDWIAYIFTAWTRCSNGRCKTEYALSGVGGVEPDYVNNDEWEYFDHFYPRMCNPPLEMFSLPSRCPDVIAEPLRVAFSLFWADAPACAGRLRVVLERVLDHLGVPTGKKAGEQQEQPQSLHARIEAYAKNAPELGGHLMALKWLGNTASHESNIRKADLLDAFEVLDYCLIEIIEKRSEKLAAIAKRLTERHKTPKPTPKPKTEG